MKNLISRCILALMLMSSTAYGDISPACNDMLEGKSATMLVGARAGGGADTYARVISPLLSDISGMQVRVVNNASGGGEVARSLALAGGDESPVLYFTNATSLAQTALPQDINDSLLSEFNALGGVTYFEPNTWISNGDFDVTNHNIAELVASATSVEGYILRLALVGRALGIDVSIVGGYDGSSDMVGAILRGEVDITSLSLDGALRRTDGNNTKVSLILSDRPNPSLPTVPHLLGKGSALEARAQDITTAELAEREQAARIAIALSGTTRAVLIGRQVSSPLRNCLSEAVEAVYKSERFEEITRVQNMPYGPILGSEGDALIVSLLDAFHDSRQIINELIHAQNNR